MKLMKTYLPLFLITAISWSTICLPVTDTQVDKKVTVHTTDGQISDVSANVLKTSTTLLHQMESYPDATECTVGINTEKFQAILSFLEHIANKETNSPTLAPRMLSLEELVQLIETANFLDVEQLIAQGTARCAQTLSMRSNISAFTQNPENILTQLKMLSPEMDNAIATQIMSTHPARIWLLKHCKIKISEPVKPSSIPSNAGNATTVTTNSVHTAKLPLSVYVNGKKTSVQIVANQSNRSVVELLDTETKSLLHTFKDSTVISNTSTSNDTASLCAEQNSIAISTFFNDGKMLVWNLSPLLELEQSLKNLSLEQALTIITLYNLQQNNGRPTLGNLAPYFDSLPDEIKNIFLEQLPTIRNEIANSSSDSGQSNIQHNNPQPSLLGRVWSGIKNKTRNLFTGTTLTSATTTLTKLPQQTWNFMKTNKGKVVGGSTLLAAAGALSYYLWKR